MASKESTIVEKQEEEQQHRQPIERFKYSNRVVLKSILGREDRGMGLVGERVVVGGWVKSCKEKPRQVATVVADVTCTEILMSRLPILRSLARIVRGQPPSVAGPDAVPVKTLPSVAHLRINDGSCTASLQITVDSSVSPVKEITFIGTCILVEGIIKKPLLPSKHVVEVKVEKVLHVGTVDPEKYPMAKAKLSLDSIRFYPQFRPRTTMVASITRIRNSLSYTTHNFFQSNGFLHVHMPIITTTIPRTQSHVFQVRALYTKSDDVEKIATMNDKEDINPEAVRTAIKEKSKRIEELKRSDSNREALVAALRDLQKANELALHLEEKQRMATTKAREEDFSKDFFLRQTYLSVSAELHLESYACALSSVYTFGPTFNAEGSQSIKNLAERWMVEVEMAFAELEDAMDCAEDCLKFLCRTILENCPNDTKFISKQIDKKCIDRIKSVESNSFARITYTEAVDILKKATDKKFEAQVEWGINLSKEHEMYLADEVYKQPIIVYNYPKEVKPFYVRIKDDGRTVSAFNIIAPKAGVLVQGSQKEERIDIISKRIQELGLPKEQYDWYMDLRRHGTVKHSGFSLGLEDMIVFVTGIDDTRDAIPFPRARGYASA